MMGRNAQPTNILLAKGRKHLTKSEIEHREKSKIKVGDNKLKCPDFVKNDVNAYIKFKEILKIYIIFVWSSCFCVSVCGSVFALSYTSLK